MQDLDETRRTVSVSSKEAPADSAKRRQIIEGARAVFLAQGFDRASMDEIARTAGVSKGTLYVYFDNKQRLFEELIIEDRREQAEQIVEVDLADRDIRAALTAFGISLVETMQRPRTIALIRTVIAAAGQFPEIGRTLYAAGPLHGIERIGAYFEAKRAEGLMAMPDPQLAAAQFLDLCLCRILKPLLFSFSGPAPRAKIEKVVGSAVDVILMAYGRQGVCAERT